MHPKAIYESCPICPGRDEKIGKKDQQDCPGSEVERESLWKKKRGLADIRKPDDGLGKKTTGLRYTAV